MNDTDVKGRIERTEFESLVVAKFRDTLIAPIQRAFETQAVKDLKITKENLHSVEIVGGGSRIPIIQKILKDYLGKELFKTCDSDESIARGCALQCAMLSPMFKVKEFQVYDIYNYPIDLAWGPAPSSGQDAMEVEVQKSTTLFQLNNPIPSIKSVAFPDRTEPFQLIARYTDTKPSPFPQGYDPLIGRWIVGGIPKPSDPSKPIPKIKVFVKLNISSVLTVSSAQHLEDYIVEEPIEEPKPEPKPNTAAKEGEKKEGEKKEGEKKKKVKKKKVKKKMAKKKMQKKKMVKKKILIKPKVHPWRKNLLKRTNPKQERRKKLAKPTSRLTLSL